MMRSSLLQDIDSALGHRQNDPMVSHLSFAIGAATRRVVEDLVYLDYTPQGVSLLFENGLFEAAFFYSDGYEGHSAYTGDLPGGIRFGDRKKLVLTKLGTPNAFGGGTVGPLGEIIPPWCKFVWMSHFVTVQFTRTYETVDLVSVWRG